MSRNAIVLLAVAAVAACGSDPVHPGGGTVVVSVVIEPSAAKAVTLQISGSGATLFASTRSDLVVEKAELADRIVVAAFGDNLSGSIGTLPNVAPKDAGVTMVQVLDAVGADNRPLPLGTVTARAVVDTIR